MIGTAVITLIGAYLLGSINFAVIFSNIFIKGDIRNYGSGNAGTTNIMRVGGALPGILTFICDVAKGAVASGMGYLMFQYIGNHSDASYGVGLYGAYACGVACIIGHVFPLFFGFKGGKGVATSVGIYAICCPIACAVGLAFFAVLLLISKIVSLSSMSAAVVTVIVSLVLCNTEVAAFWPQAVLSIIIGAIIIVTHKGNIKRLIAGEERRIGHRR